MAEQKEYLDIQEEDGVIRVSFMSIGEIAAQSALAVQSAVKTAVDAAVGIEVAAVNVFVAGMAVR